MSHPILKQVEEAARAAEKAAKAAKAAQVAAESAAKAAEAAYGAAVEAASVTGPAAAKAAIDAVNALSSAARDTGAGVHGASNGRTIRALDVQIASGRASGRADSADRLEVTPVIGGIPTDAKPRNHSNHSRSSSTSSASASASKRRWRVAGMPAKLAARVAQKRVGNGNVVLASGGGGTVISKAEAARAVEVASSMPAVAARVGPQSSDLQRYLGKWKAAGIEGRDEFMKAMQLPWILRKIAAALPQPDNVFFLDDEGVLRSHVSTMGRVVEEIYKEGGQSTKSFKGVTTTVTYHWDGACLTYVAVKDGAPEEEAKSRRWVEADGVTMRAESHFRKNASQPWVVLLRTWQLDPASR